MWSILRLLREDPDKLRWSQQRRGLDTGIVDEALRYDRLWREALSELNKLRHEHNVLSRQIARLKGPEREAKIREARELLKRIEEREKLVRAYEEKRNELLLSIPNVVHESVPVGEDESDNVPLRSVSAKKASKCPSQTLWRP